MAVKKWVVLPEGLLACWGWFVSQYQICTSAAKSEVKCCVPLWVRNTHNASLFANSPSTKPIPLILFYRQVCSDFVCTLLEEDNKLCSFV